MGLFVLIITDEWRAKHDQLNASYDGNKTNEFNDFNGAYSKHYHDAQDFDIATLATELSKIGINNKRIVKVFNYLYVWTGLKGDRRDHITGFCDVTEFLKDIKSEYERDYCFEALKQFMHYGGIVRINEIDLVYDEVDELNQLIKDNTPNVI